MAFIAQRIARRGCSQSHRSGDIARINLFDLLPFVGVHLEEPADSFSFALGRIIDARTRSQRTGIDPKKAQCPDEGVGHDLESEGRKGRIIFCGTLFYRLRGCTPLFRNAEPHRTGTILMARAALRIALRNSLSLISFPSRYFSMMLSSQSAAASKSLSWYCRASAIMLSGIASTRNLAPKLSSSQITAFIWTKSMIPANFSSDPIGNCSATGRAPRRSSIILTTR